MTVLIVGDSYAYGSELSDSPLTSWRDPGKIPHPPSKSSFGALLADMLSQDYENYSIPGGSNDRTFRVTFKKILEKKYDFVLCVWTNFSRLDMTYMGIDMPITYSNSEYFKEKFPWFKSIFENHYDPKKDAESWFTKLISLQSYFTLTKQPYLFVNSCITKGDFKFIPKSNDRFVNRNNFFGWREDDSLMDMCKNLPQGAGGHFLQEGHDLVAKKLYEHLTR
jgi:hypothetical protein